MNTQRYTISLLLLVLVIGASFSFAAAEDFYISDVEVTPEDERIRDGDELTVTIEHEGIAGEFNLTLDTANFDPQNGLTEIKVSGSPIELDLIYKGGDTSLSFTVDDGTSTSQERLSLSGLAEFSTGTSSDGDSEPIDKSEYTPEVHILTERLTLEAGKTTDVTLKLENKASNYARDVSLELINTEDMKVFDVDFETLSRLGGKDQEELEGSIRVMTTAKSQLYKLPVRLTYTNAFGIDKSRETVLEIRIENNEVTPLVSVDEFLTKDEVLHIGENDTLALRLKNHGTLEAKDVRVTLSGIGEGLRLNRDVNVKAVEDLSYRETALVTYNLSVDDFATKGLRTLTLTFAYNDVDGNTYERTETLEVYLQDAAEDGLKVISKQHPKRVTAGQTFTVTAVLENSSDKTLYNAEASVEYPTGFVAVDAPKDRIGTLEEGERATVTFEIMAKEDLATEFYDLYLVTAHDAPYGGEREEEKHYLGIGIEGASAMGRPKLIIEDYSFDGDQIQAGETFTLRLNIRNTSDAETVKNIKVSFEAQEGIFDPVDSANALFIKSIGRSDMAVAEMTFKAKNNAEVKGYNVDITMAYENAEGAAYDSEGNPFEETDKITIPVYQPVRLETSDIMLPMESFVGVPGEVQLDFYNMGKAQMYNMMVKLTGDFTVQDSNYFVGNFDTGASDYYIGTIIPDSPGQKEGAVVFTFEDSQGNVDTVEVPFSVMVSEMQQGPMGPEGPGFEEPFPGEEPMMPGEESSGPSPWLYLVVVLAAIAAMVFYVRRRKKKREELLMAEDDDDL